MLENNKRNFADFTAADECFDDIMVQEHDFSIVIKVSMQSLREMRRNTGKATTFKGLNVSKSRSRPVKYSFQMENQIAVKLASGELKSALCHFILEPLSDPSKCSNKQSCFLYSDFCSCNSFLPVRVKVVIISDEKEHQKCAKAWVEKIKSIFSNQKPECPGLSLGKVICIAKNTFHSIVEIQNEKDGNSEHKVLTLTKTIARKRKVIDQASALLGFSVIPVNQDDLESAMNSEENLVITNHAPRDFCEICWTSLSNTGEG